MGTREIAQQDRRFGAELEWARQITNNICTFDFFSVFVPYLFQRVQDNRIYWVDDKNIPLAALASLAPEEVEEALIGALQSKNPKVRTWATSKFALSADDK